jgi:hypothetical protein
VSGAAGVSAIKSQDLREWLTYIASDELQGRAVYSDGIGGGGVLSRTTLKAWA